jgi:hypothetical protein
MKPNFWSFRKDSKDTKKLYKDPANLVDIEFANRTDEERYIWIEPSCEEIHLKSDTEYRVITHDKSFRIEFDKDMIVFYFQYSFGFRLYKRPASEDIPNPHEWTLDFDNSDNN